MEQWLLAHLPQIAVTTITLVVSPRAVRLARHLWTLQTKYDNEVERNAYLTDQAIELKADVEYYKNSRHGSDSSSPPATTPTRTR